MQVAMSMNSIADGQEKKKYRDLANIFVENQLLLNVSKTNKMVMGLNRRNIAASTITIMGCDVGVHWWTKRTTQRLCTGKG